MELLTQVVQVSAKMAKVNVFMVDLTMSSPHFSGNYQLTLAVRSWPPGFLRGVRPRLFPDVTGNLADRKTRLIERQSCS